MAKICDKILLQLTTDKHEEFHFICDLIHFNFHTSVITSCKRKNYDVCGKLFIMFVGCY